MAEGGDDPAHQAIDHLNFVRDLEVEEGVDSLACSDVELTLSTGPDGDFMRNEFSHGLEVRVGVPEADL